MIRPYGRARSSFPANLDHRQRWMALIGY